MDQDEEVTRTRNDVLSLELPADAKQWLLNQSAERTKAGRPVAERSMGGVIRDLIAAAMKDEVAA